MIAHITGKLIRKQPNTIIVEVGGGLGYELNIPLSTFYNLGDMGSSVSLHVHTHVREDSLQLFGFATELEKKLFLLFTSVSGIGPKLAITALSGMSAEELIQAIRSSNLVKLTAVPGVGKKTAERVILELKDKLSALSSQDIVETHTPSDDVISALVNLGYVKQAAEKAVLNATKEMPNANFETTLKMALKQLAK